MPVVTIGDDDTLKIDDCGCVVIAPVTRSIVIVRLPDPTVQDGELGSLLATFHHKPEAYDPLGVCILSQPLGAVIDPLN